MLGEAEQKRLGDYKEQLGEILTQLRELKERSREHAQELGEYKKEFGELEGRLEGCKNWLEGDYTEQLEECEKRLGELKELLGESKEQPGLKKRSAYLLASVSLHGFGLMAGVGVTMNPAISAAILAGFSASAYYSCISTNSAVISSLAVAGAVYTTKAYASSLASTFLMSAQNIEKAGLVLIMSTSLAVSIYCLKSTQVSSGASIT